MGGKSHVGAEPQRSVTARDVYFFDLQGYLHLRGALTAAEVRACNDCLDAIPPLAVGDWHGYVHGHTFGDHDGLNYQQIYEAGRPFEELIDHPAWFDKARHFVGAEGTFDEQHGPLLIDEAFANVRTAGESIGLHNGGHLGLSRCQFRYHAGRFHCNQINVLVALTAIGPGDGGTVLIPGSHKSNFEHPSFERFRMGVDRPDPARIEGAVEVHMAAGDALLFVDCCTHGSSRRTNDGVRRVVVYRYGPSWGRLRHAYRPSPELLARLTPRRRGIVAPASDRRLAPQPGRQSPARPQSQAAAT